MSNQEEIIDAGRKAGLEEEIYREIQKLHTAPCYDELRNFALHFAECGAKLFKEQIVEELTKFKWDPMKHLKK